MTEQTTDQSPDDSTLISVAGSRPLFQEELRARVTSGARLVRFESCFSPIVFTLRRQSPLYLTNSWQERYVRGLGYSLLTILLGPWGVPWGLIYTPRSIWLNLTGGVDETDAVLVQLDVHSNQTSQVSTRPPATGNPGTP